MTLDFSTSRKLRTSIISQIPLRAVTPDIPEIRLHHIPFDLDDESGIHALTAWPGGIWLARHILDNPNDFRGRKAIDIGTGSGLVAIALVMAGAEVTAVDSDSRVLTLCRLNMKQNNVRAKVQKGGFSSIGGTNKYDVITSTDTLYSEKILRRSMTSLIILALQFIWQKVTAI